MPVRLAALLLLVGSTAACAGTDELTKAIGTVVTQGPTNKLAVADHTSFSWERMCLFGPYTSIERLESVVGVKDVVSAAHDISKRDDVSLLIFVHEGRIVRSVPHPRSRGDFGPELVGRCYSPQQAVFRIRVPPTDSWGNIGPF